MTTVPSQPPANPPANPPVPTMPTMPVIPKFPMPGDRIRLVQVPSRTYRCKACGRQASKQGALDQGWIEVQELDNTNMVTDDYYLCSDCQAKVEWSYVNVEPRS